MTQAPFSITPDPDFLFLSHDHKEALAHLLYGVGDTGGFVQLTGEVGTGKTTLCRYLLENTPEEVDVALILNPRQSALELVASICDELSVAYPEGNDSIKTLIDRLNVHLLAQHAEGRRTVLVIDEAQNLSVEVLEQVRLLTNLETARHKLLQILLIGQPELQAMMNRPELRQLDQRITARYHLAPLSMPETIAYIDHRLIVAGGRKHLFSTRALKEVYRCSRGVPRLINIICDRALLGAYARNADRIDIALVKQAEKEIKGQRPPVGKMPGWTWGVAVLLVLMVGGGWAYSRWPFGASPPSNAQGQKADALEETTQSLGQSDTTKAPLEKPPAGTATGRVAIPANEAGHPAASTEEIVDDRRVGSSGDIHTAETPPEAIWPEKSEAADTGQSQPPEKINTTGTMPSPEHSENVKSNRPLPEIPIATGPRTPYVARSRDSAEGEPKPKAVSRPDLLALAVPREKRPPKPAQDLATLLIEGRMATNANTAFTELFRYWQLDFDDLQGNTACVRALSAGLRCLQKTGSLAQLIRANRPAVLTLFDDHGRVHYVMLAAVAGNRMTLNIGGQERRFPQADVLAAWNGQYVLLWRPPLLENAFIQIGTRGNDVLWLRDRLARIEGGDLLSPVSLENPTFDETLREQVVRFQERNGLRADGVVGDNTLIQLNTALADDHTPTLTPLGQEKTR